MNKDSEVEDSGMNVMSLVRFSLCYLLTKIECSLDMVGIHSIISMTTREPQFTV